MLQRRLQDNTKPPIPPASKKAPARVMNLSSLEQSSPGRPKGQKRPNKKHCPQSASSRLVEKTTRISFSTKKGYCKGTKVEVSPPFQKPSRHHTRADSYSRPGPSVSPRKEKMAATTAVFLHVFFCPIPNSSHLFHFHEKLERAGEQPRPPSARRLITLSRRTPPTFRATFAHLLT